MENIFKIEVDGVEQYPITSQKAVNTVNDINIDLKFAEIDTTLLQKQDKLVSGENISKINGESLLTGADIIIEQDISVSKVVKSINKINV